MIKKVLKNQKGLTLIELLAVIVILGIIAAIAVPSIGKVIDNSNKDAHVSNAQQIVNAAKLYITTENLQIPVAPASGTAPTPLEVDLQDLIDNDFIDPVKDPSVKASTYSATATKVTVIKKTTGNEYTVTVVANDGSTVYIPATEINSVVRGTVQNN